MKLLGRMDSECRFGNIVANSNISALITFATASAATKVPKWENLECEVKLSSVYFFWIFHSSLLAGGAQVPVLGRHPHLGRGSGGVRAVRRLAGQHWQCPGAELPHEVWSLQDRVVHGQVVLD